MYRCPSELGMSETPMEDKTEIRCFILGQFLDLCEFVEMAVFEDATYL